MLTIQSIFWMTTDKSMGEQLLGHPTLKALWVNTKNVFAAAADHHDGEIDVIHVDPIES